MEEYLAVEIFTIYIFLGLDGIVTGILSDGTVEYLVGRFLLFAGQLLPHDNSHASFLERLVWALVVDSYGSTYFALDPAAAVIFSEVVHQQERHTVGVVDHWWILRFQLAV